MQFLPYWKVSLEIAEDRGYNEVVGKFWFSIRNKNSVSNSKKIYYINLWLFIIFQGDPH